MRKRYPQVVEDGRILSGDWGSPPYDAQGAFIFKMPKTRVLTKVIASNEGGWEHVSVTLRVNRCPTWEEMCIIKDLFFDKDECVIQYHPPSDRYVNCHPGCLHLWRPLKQAVPMPPIWMV